MFLIIVAANVGQLVVSFITDYKRSKLTYLSLIDNHA